MNTEEKNLRTAIDPLDEDAVAEKKAESRWIDDEIRPETEKKKPYIQIPVIISICLVAASLLAFFAYKFIFISEPEGVIWKWHSESDDMDYYFEFQENNVFKAYFGSFEITANYEKEKGDNGDNTLTISDSSMSVEKIGCFAMGEKMKYDISGLRVGGNQEMTLSSEEDIVMKQSAKWENPLELPEDFKEDEDLTGEWINVFSSDNAKQTLLFNDDGSMELTASYTFTKGQQTVIRRYCTYTVENAKTKEMNITWVGIEPVVHHSEYTIKDGILYFEGSYFYRADNNPATPDQE